MKYLFYIMLTCAIATTLHAAMMWRISFDAAKPVMTVAMFFIAFTALSLMAYMHEGKK